MKEAIIVEGKYDKMKLSSLVDGVILETNGFGIFKDRERMELFRRLAESRGLVILTDSDGAGFLIRGKLSSCIPPEYLKNAYIPDLFGKERRKAEPSKEGKLGVEGMSLDILRESLVRAGATVEEAGQPAACQNFGGGGSGDGAEASAGAAGGPVNGAPAQSGAANLSGEREKLTKGDLFQLGLAGGPNSAEKRRRLQKALGLPERLSANGLLQVLNALYGRAELEQRMAEYCMEEEEA